MAAVAMHNRAVCPDHDELVAQYVPLVRQVAGRIAVFLPAHIQTDDLLGDGILGLLDAIQKFDAGRGVAFKTYAALRIRGAILDGLRQLDWVPRRVRRLARTVDDKQNELSLQLGRTASEVEVAAALGLPSSDLTALRGELNRGGISSLDDVRRLTDDASMLLGEHVADPTQSVDTNIEQTERRAILEQAIRRLTEREQAVLSLYYFEGLTVKETAQVLSISEPRVCQLHSRALQKLREALSGQAELLAS